LTSWREAKPCSDELRRLKEELVDLGQITMMVLCAEDNVSTTRAQTWADRAVKHPWRAVYPTVVRNCSEILSFLQREASQNSKDGAIPQFDTERTVPQFPTQAPAEALDGTWMPLLPPLLMSHASLVEPQVTPSLMSSSVQVPFCIRSWPQPLLPIPPPGPKEVELPRPARILKHRTAPSSPPLPKFLGNMSTESSAAAAADAQANAEASTDSEMGMESESQGLNKLLTKLLEFDAWVPTNMTKESASAVSAEAAAADAAAKADSKAVKDADAETISCDPIANFGPGLHCSGSAASEPEGS